MKKNDTHEKKSASKAIFILISILAFIAIVALSIFAYFNFGLNRPGQEDFSTFGTYIGGVITPLITLGTVAVLLLQFKEFREQIELTRSQLSVTQEQLENQNITMEREFGFELKRRHFEEFRELLSATVFCSKLKDETLDYSLGTICAKFPYKGGDQVFAKNIDTITKNLKKLERSLSDVCLAGLLACINIPRVSQKDSLSLQAVAAKYFFAWSALETFYREKNIDFDDTYYKPIHDVWREIKNLTHNRS